MMRRTVAALMLSATAASSLWSSRLKHQATGCASQADPDVEECLL